VDPRFNSPNAEEPRLSRAGRITRLQAQNLILKASNANVILAKAHKLSITPKNPSKAPNSAQIEHERSMWGPHPDPNQDWVETQLYLRGAVFLRECLKLLLGKTHVELAKAEGPPSWGDIAKLFGSPESPEKKMSIWENLIDAFTTHILPSETVEAVAGAWALRSSLLSILGDRVRGIGETVKDWAAYHKILPSHRKEAVEWQKVHAARFITNLKDSTRKAIKNTLIQAEIENIPRGEMHQRLLDNFGTLNRDWRRLVLTETASGSASGKLAQAAGLEGFEAVWTGTPNACPFCYRMYRRVFQIVSPEHPNKDGQKQVWPGKSNIGRSPSPYRKDGTKRKPEELWWPAIPAHPNCCCSWEIRKTVTPETASSTQIAMRTKIDALMAKRRKADEEFFKTVSSKKG
jgi:hypothetical protein